jgi:threonine/homoserine/homoserine lactone efflux protein
VVTIDALVLASFVVTTSTFLVLPGPVNVIVVDTAVRFGLRGAIVCIAGVNLASIVLILASNTIFSEFLLFNPQLLTALTVAGGLYLLYFAFDMCTSSNQTRDSEFSKSTLEAHRSGVVPVSKLAGKGFLVGVSNPKDVLFFLSFFPPFVSKLGLGLVPSASVLAGLWCFLEFVLLCAYAVGVVRFVTPKIEKAIMRICAALFAVLGTFAIASAGWSHLAN